MVYVRLSVRSGSTAPRPRGTTFTQTICTAQSLPNVLCQATHNLRIGSVVISLVLFRPSGELYSRFQSVQRQTTTVEFARAWNGEEGGGDDASSGLAVCVW